MWTALIGLDGFTKIKLNKRKHKVVCIKKSRSENSQREVNVIKIHARMERSL